MLKRHRDNLDTRLEEVATRGYAFITWPELYLWYGAERLNSRSYRDLLSSYLDIVGKEEGDLVVSNINGGILLIDREDTRNLSTIIEKGWNNAWAPEAE